MATTTTTTIQCPALVCTCGGTERVEAVTSPKAKTIRVAACAPLLAQGWTGHQLAILKADAHRYGL